jgi:hypothetical protein
MAKAAKTKTPSKSQKSPDQPDEPEIEETEVEEADEEVAPEPPPSEGDEEPAGTTPAPAGSRKVIIDGEGTMPLVGIRVERGKPIEVNEDQLAELKAGNYGFKETK